MYNDLSSRPAWFSHLQHLADAVGGAKYLVHLDPEEMIEAAKESTGLADFGPGKWREHYEVLVRSLNDEANLNLVGRITARTEIIRSLRNRLHIQALIDHHPEILDEVIEAPIFIGGFGRTGTSITHELLALNSKLRAPLTWEAHQVGDESVNGHSASDRIAQTHAEQLLYNEIAPEYLTMHENDAEHPSECAMLHWSEFQSHNWTGPYFVPTFEFYSMEQDQTPVYKFQKRYLQVLQWQEAQANGGSAPRRRWVLKSPGHELHLPVLFSVFPDATFLHTHRDMSKVVGSMCSLLGTLRWMKSDHVNTDIFAYIGQGISARFDAIVADRESGTLPADPIHDLFFQDLIKNPVDTLRKVYQFIGLDFTEQDQATIEHYLDNKPIAKHGKHEYSLEQFGYTKDQLNEIYASYMEYFGVPFEA